MQDEKEQLTSALKRCCIATASVSQLFAAPERITVLKSPNLVFFFLWR